MSTCCLKVSQTSNTQDCHIIHRWKNSVIYPPKPQGLVMACASRNSLCGISFMSFGVMQRQSPLEFMTYSWKFILRWFEFWFNLRCDMFGLQGCASRSESNRSVHLISLLASQANNEGTDQTVHITDHDAAHFTFEPEHDKMTHAHSEDSGHSGHPHSLIRVIVRCMDS